MRMLRILEEVVALSLTTLQTAVGRPDFKLGQAAPRWPEPFSGRVKAGLI